MADFPVNIRSISIDDGARDRRMKRVAPDMTQVNSREVAEIREQVDAPHLFLRTSNCDTAFRYQRAQASSEHKRMLLLLLSRSLRQFVGCHLARSLIDLMQLDIPAGVDVEVKL